MKLPPDAIIATGKLASYLLRWREVDVIEGDGTRGWPEAAPYDAIIVAAGGIDVPPALRSQLAVGGRLVIPVGPTPREQLSTRSSSASGPSASSRATFAPSRWSRSS